jgi:hypothetical protein
VLARPDRRLLRPPEDVDEAIDAMSSTSPAAVTPFRILPRTSADAHAWAACTAGDEVLSPEKSREAVAVIDPRARGCACFANIAEAGPACCSCGVSITLVSHSSIACFSVEAAAAMRNQMTGVSLVLRHLAQSSAPPQNQLSRFFTTPTFVAMASSSGSKRGAGGGGDGEIDISTLSAEQLQGLLKQVDGVSKTATKLCE